MAGKIARRRQPDCGHKRLAECPLTVEDWNTVFLAWLGFRQTCLLVSEQAHERAAAKENADA